MKRGIRIRNSVIVLTGASSGLGRATARAFARRGARLVLVARRGDVLAELSAECEKLGSPHAIAAPADVTDPHALDEIARQTVAAFGRIDAWINNAGVYLSGSFDSIPLEVHRRVVETNLLGVIHGARAALSQFRLRGRGVLINVSSQAGRAAYKYTSTYCATQFAIRGLGEALRQDVENTRIAVCTILPGAIDTPLFEHAANYSGRVLRPVPPIYRPGRVARAIVKTLRRPRRERTIGASPRLTALLHVLWPGLYERLAARHIERTHFEDDPAPRADGNLFVPAGSTSVSGGWRRRALGRKLAFGALLLGAGALVARRRLAA